MMNQRKRWPGSRRTKIAYENCLCSIRRPFPVNDRRVLIDVETKFKKAFSKRVVASFVLLYGVLPLYEGLMPASDGGKEGLKPRIEFEYGFLDERHATKRKWAADSNTKRRADVTRRDWSDRLYRSPHLPRGNTSGYQWITNDPSYTRN